MASLLLCLLLVPPALASDLEAMRERYAGALQVYATRIAEMEAKGGGGLTAAETREWQTDGSERRRLREAVAALQRNLRRASTNLAQGAETASDMMKRVQNSGVLEQLARIEDGVGEARERLGARWEFERAALQRQREQRERDTAERLRGLR